MFFGMTTVPFACTGDNCPKHPFFFKSCDSLVTEEKIFFFPLLFITPFFSLDNAITLVGLVAPHLKLVHKKKKKN